MNIWQNGRRIDRYPINPPVNSDWVLGQSVKMLPRSPVYPWDWYAFLSTGTDFIPPWGWDRQRPRTSSAQFWADGQFTLRGQPTPPTTTDAFRLPTAETLLPWTAPTGWIKGSRNGRAE